MTSQKAKGYIAPFKAIDALEQGLGFNMTPMIDVTFQLLLFFLLTCEFRESEGMIPGTLPKLRHVLDRIGIPLSGITHLLVTHYHPDHVRDEEDLD